MTYVLLYSETKGERTYVLNKFGAFCYALNLPPSAAAATKDYSAFVGTTIAKKEMAQLVKIKRILKSRLTKKAANFLWQLWYKI